MSASQEYIDCIRLKNKMGLLKERPADLFYHSDLVYMEGLLDKRIQELEPEVTVKRED